MHDFNPSKSFTLSNASLDLNLLISQLCLDNSGSMQLERGWFEIEKLEGEISFPRDNFHFLRSDNPDQRKGKLSQGKERACEVFYQRATILLKLLTNTSFVGSNGYTLSAI